MTSPTCPRCTSAAIRRSKRRGLERLLSVVGLFPFRCEQCDARFLAFRTRAAA